MTALHEGEQCCCVSKVKRFIKPNYMAKQKYFLFHEKHFHALMKSLSMFCSWEVNISETLFVFLAVSMGYTNKIK